MNNASRIVNEIEQDGLSYYYYYIELITPWPIDNTLQLSITGGSLQHPRVTLKQ